MTNEEFYMEQLDIAVGALLRIYKIADTHIPDNSNGALTEALQDVCREVRGTLDSMDL